MASTIKLKRGSGAPAASALVEGEPAFDLTNKRLYTENSGGAVLEIGTNPTTLQVDGTLTVGVNDTGYDVKLFGATSGKSLLWDESADSLIVTGSTSQQGTLTVGVDDTGYDVKFFGATSGKSMLWDESADSLIVNGTVDVVGTVAMDGGSTSANFTFGDNDKAIFGDGSDLEIYHQGGYSYIHDTGTGPLYIRATDLLFKSAADNDDYAKFIENGAVTLYYSNAAKIATTSTGVDVTGTVTADKVDIGNGVAGGTSEILFSDNVSSRGKIIYDHSSSPETLVLQTTGTTALSIDNSQNISIPTGDLTIGNDIGHLDNGGNARLLYDRSANLLGNTGTNVIGATVTSSGNASITDGNLIVASGHGIDFSATGNSSGSVDSELLDDYEEGTWVPVATERSGATSREIPNAAYNTTFTGGWYTKIGSVVTFGGCIRLTNADPTSASYELRITGLPFTSQNRTPYGQARSAVSTDVQAGLDGLAADRLINSYININSAHIDIRYFDNSDGSGANMPASYVQDDFLINFGGSYNTSS